MSAPAAPPGVVPWDEDSFLVRNPQFVGKLTSAQLLQAWDIACLIQRNDAKSMIPYAPEKGVYTRRTILYLLTCHLATLALRPYDQAGPVSSATEGSVSVSFSVPTDLDKYYFLQTPCGATYWQLIKQFAYGGYYFNNQEAHSWG